MKLLILLVVSTVAEPDYYWRAYHGSVPDDAIVATDDGTRRSYIGNVPIWGGGLYIGQLDPGVRTITVTGHSFNSSDGVIHNRIHLIQILCSRHPSMFEWIATNSKDIHTIPYHLVIGGYENYTHSQLNIGRKKRNGFMRIGKVTAYHHKADRDVIYIVNGGQELGFLNYEVLVYKEVAVDESCQRK